MSWAFSKCSAFPVSLNVIHLLKPKCNRHTGFCSYWDYWGQSFLSILCLLRVCGLINRWSSLKEKIETYAIFSFSSLTKFLTDRKRCFSSNCISTVSDWHRHSQSIATNPSLCQKHEQRELSSKNPSTYSSFTVTVVKYNVVTSFPACFEDSYLGNKS